MSSLSLPMPLASGFVGFDESPPVRVAFPPPAAPVVPSAPTQRVAVDEAAVPAALGQAVGEARLLQAPTWQPASSRRVRIVEGLVVAALCGWFLYGGLAIFSLV